jgi:hypothetical protein
MTRPAKRKSGQALSDNEATLQALNSREFYRTIRWGIVAAGIFGCVGWITWAYVKKGDTPVWQAILQASLPALFPTAIAYRWRRRLRQYMKSVAERFNKLESSIDPNRTSSGLNSDGTDRHDQL